MTATIRPTGIDLSREYRKRIAAYTVHAQQTAQLMAEVIGFERASLRAGVHCGASLDDGKFSLSRNSRQAKPGNCRA
jgi:hypothetical protein